MISKEHGVKNIMELVLRKDMEPE